jgi:hypothetical protein
MRFSPIFMAMESVETSLRPPYQWKSAFFRKNRRKFLELILNHPRYWSLDFLSSNSKRIHTIDLRKLAFSDSDLYNEIDTSGNEGGIEPYKSRSARRSVG